MSLSRSFVLWGLLTSLLFSAGCASRPTEAELAAMTPEERQALAERNQRIIDQAGQAGQQAGIMMIQ